MEKNSNSYNTIYSFTARTPGPHTPRFFFAHTIGHISFDTAVVGNSLDIKWVFFFLIKGQVLKYLDTTKVIQAESRTIGLMAVVIRALR